MKITQEWDIQIDGVDFGIELYEDGTAFMNMLQGEDYDQQCIQLHSKEGLIKLRDFLNVTIKDEKENEK